MLVTRDSGCRPSSGTQGFPSALHLWPLPRATLTSWDANQGQEGKTGRKEPLCSPVTTGTSKLARKDQLLDANDSEPCCCPAQGLCNPGIWES